MLSFFHLHIIEEKDDMYIHTCLFMYYTTNMTHTINNISHFLFMDEIEVSPTYVHKSAAHNIVPGVYT